jgi:hypothetical protein
VRAAKYKSILKQTILLTLDWFLVIFFNVWTGRKFSFTISAWESAICLFIRDIGISPWYKHRRCVCVYRFDLSELKVLTLDAHKIFDILNLQRNVTVPAKLWAVSVKIHGSKFKQQGNVLGCYLKIILLDIWIIGIFWDKRNSRRMFYIFHI